MPKLVIPASIIRDRLEHKARRLRIDWHEQGARWLADRQYLTYMTGLEDVTRKLAAIEVALARLPRREQKALASVA